jgi:hypothetical protein
MHSEQLFFTFAGVCCGAPGFSLDVEQVLRVEPMLLEN